MQNRWLTRVSLSLNLIFILALIMLGCRFYPKLKSRFGARESMTAVSEVAFAHTDTVPTIYFPASKFEIIGQLPDAINYSRLPEKAEMAVRPAVWALSKNSSGISIRFASNSSKIKIRWTLTNNFNTVNMTPVASKGFDLYAEAENRWQFVGVAKPSGKIENEAEIITGMEPANREYLLNLPLYDGVESLEIGVDEGSSITKPIHKIIDTGNPIVFYGTSITQGASASRPGLTYAALLERFFNKEVINLGFSGNGRFEKQVANFIMTAKPSVIVLDCTQNSPPDTIRKNLPATIGLIRSLNSTVPILLVETVVSDFASFKKDNKSLFGSRSYINEQNRALKDVYQTKQKIFKNIYYMSGEELIGKDHEATIDGIHFNDLGHHRAFESLRRELQMLRFDRKKPQTRRQQLTAGN